MGKYGKIIPKEEITEFFTFVFELIKGFFDQKLEFVDIVQKIIANFELDIFYFIIRKIGSLFEEKVLLKIVGVEEFSSFEGGSLFLRRLLRFLDSLESFDRSSNESSDSF